MGASTRYAVPLALTNTIQRGKVLLEDLEETGAADAPTATRRMGVTHEPLADAPLQ